MPGRNWKNANPSNSGAISARHPERNPVSLVSQRDDERVRSRPRASRGSCPRHDFVIAERQLNSAKIGMLVAFEGEGKVKGIARQNLILRNLLPHAPRHRAVSESTAPAIAGRQTGREPEFGMSIFEDFR